MKTSKVLNSSFEKLNWQAEPQPLITGGGLEVVTHKAMVRSDNKQVIGIVGADYVPVQHDVAFAIFKSSFANDFVTNSNVIELLGGAKVIFRVTGKSREIRKGDEVQECIDIINGFDCRTTWQARYSMWRQVCSNGLFGWATESFVNIRHTPNAINRITEAMRVFKGGQEFFNRFVAASKSMAKAKLTEATVDKMLKALTISEKNQDAIKELFEGAGKGLGGFTKWDMYNAYTEWLDHYRGTEAHREFSQQVGTIPMKQKAFTLISEWN